MTTGTGSGGASIPLTIEDRISTDLAQIAQHFERVRDVAHSLQGMADPFQGMRDNAAEYHRILQGLTRDLSSNQIQQVHQTVQQQMQHLQNVARLDPSVVGTTAFRNTTAQLQQYQAMYDPMNMWRVQSIGSYAGAMENQLVQPRSTMAALGMQTDQYDSAITKLQEMQSELRKLGADASPRALQEYRDALETITETAQVLASQHPEMIRSNRLLQRVLHESQETADQVEFSQQHREFKEFLGLDPDQLPSLSSSPEEAEAQRRRLQALYDPQNILRVQSIGVHTEIMDDAMDRPMDSMAALGMQADQYGGTIDKLRQLQGELRKLGADASPQVLQEYREALAAITETAQILAEQHPEMIRSNKLLQNELKQSQETASQIEASQRHRGLKEFLGIDPDDQQGPGLLQRGAHRLRQARNLLGLGGLAYGAASFIANASSTWKEEALGESRMLMASGASIPEAGRYLDAGIGPLEERQMMDIARRADMGWQDVGGWAKGSRALGMEPTQLIQAMGELAASINEGTLTNRQQLQLSATIYETSKVAGMGHRKEEFAGMVTSIGSSLALQSGGPMNLNDITGLLSAITKQGDFFRQDGVAQSVAHSALGLTQNTGDDLPLFLMQRRAGLSVEDITWNGFKGENLAKVFAQIDRETLGDTTARQQMLLRLARGNRATARGLDNMMTGEREAGFDGSTLQGLTGDAKSIEEAYEQYQSTDGGMLGRKDARMQKLGLDAGETLHKPLAQAQELLLDTIQGNVNGPMEFAQRAGTIMKENPLAATIVGAVTLGPALIDIASKGLPGFGGALGTAAAAGTALGATMTQVAASPFFQALLSSTGGAVAASTGALLLGGSSANFGFQETPETIQQAHAQSKAFYTTGNPQGPLSSKALTEIGEKRLAGWYGGSISGHFGERRGTHNHSGLDVAVPQGTPIRALVGTGGRITQLATQTDSKGNETGYGQWLEYEDETTKTKHRIAHLSGYVQGLKVGDRITASQVLGFSGGTPGTKGAGSSRGAHVHHEVYDKTGRLLNPGEWAAMQKDPHAQYRIKEDPKAADHLSEQDGVSYTTSNAAAVGTGDQITINVYPAAHHSEVEIGNQVQKQLREHQDKTKQPGDPRKVHTG